MRAEYYAHSLDDRSVTEWEPLEEHLQDVAARAGSFAAKFGAGDWGELVGLWHDLGKYQAAFQRRLRGEQIHAPHAGAGAALGYRSMDPLGLLAAFAIAGHHTGLANWISPESGPTPLRETLLANQEILDDVLKSAPPNLTSRSVPKLPSCLVGNPSFGKADAGNRPLAFFVRMLFSSLVDADRLATSEFYARAEGRLSDAQTLSYCDLETLLERLDRYIDRKSTQALQVCPSPMNRLRSDVLEACRSAATKRRGLFSLTVPTGGGKTLSAMSFALRHSVLHGQDRVIVVIPFTSIIEQNARQYRIALGDEGIADKRNVLEHHSGIDEQQRGEEDSEAERRRQIAAENWDAPIVVTTTVQFFESLFSNHPSRCRKLHRIANSVVILDEVQTLPPQFLLVILDSLRELTRHYGCTIVLSTATPPALEQWDGLPQGLTDVEPIIQKPTELFSRSAARRVQVEWRTEQVLPFDQLAAELAGHDQVLTIVHRRADARKLYELLPEAGRFHLSALMCPAHRLERIGEINEALTRKGAICRVVSTQLIEAGVDVDFPIVFRALAGLDSLAQSAGRCDREGHLSDAAGRPAGRFVVFRAETRPPAGTLHKAMQATERLLRAQGTLPELEGGLDPFNPDHGRMFFRELYQRERLDAANVQRELNGFNFANAADAFRLIDDKFSRPIVVPWRDALDRVEAHRSFPSRQTSRALQPFIVQVRRDFADHLASIGAIELWEGRLGFPTALFGSRYSPEFGMEVDVSGLIEPELLTA